VLFGTLFHLGLGLPGCRGLLCVQASGNGVLFRGSRRYRLDRIQDTDTQQGPLQSLLG